MNFTSLESTDGVDTRSFTVEGPLEDVPGVLWSPAGVSEPRPLVLMGHPGGLHKRAPGLVARARHAVTTYGYHVASIDAPGHGDRPRSPEDQQLVDAMLAARAAGEPLDSFVIDLNESIADRAVPEWRATIDALSELPQVADRIAYTGMTLATAIGIPLVVAEPRIVTAVFGGFFGAGRVLEDARRVTIPVQFILSWDDTELGRESMLALFDAFGSTTKTLRAHVGPHERVPWSEVEDSMLFVARHLE